MDLLKGLGAATRALPDPRAELGRLLADTHSVAGVRLTASGTEALVLALRSAEIALGRAPTVAWPAYSCYDLAGAAVRFGRPVRFYDLEPRTLGPEPGSLREAVRAGADVVVIVSLFGLPPDWDVLDPLLTREGVVVIEDAAQGHGGRWRGAPLGGHARFGVLSFARGKGWTGGAGGALLVRDEGDMVPGEPGAANGRSLRSEARVWAQAAAQWALGRPSVYQLPRMLPGLGLGETRYRDAPEPRALPSTAAAMLLESRGEAEAEAGRRRAVAEEYRRALGDLGPALHARVAEGGEGGWIRYPVLLPAGMGSFADAGRARALGAAPSYPMPLPSLAPLAHLARAEPPPQGWPGARLLAQRLVTLPTHSKTRAAERTELVELARGAVGRENR